MADIKAVEETSELVLDALRDASPAVKYKVMRALLGDLNFNSFERASTVPNEDGDEEDQEHDQRTWECPHCFKEYMHYEFEVIDISVRGTMPNDNDELEDRTLMMCICDSNDDYQDTAIICPNPDCKLPLNVPDGWDTDWC